MLSRPINIKLIRLNAYGPQATHAGQNLYVYCTEKVQTFQDNHFVGIFTPLRQT